MDLGLPHIVYLKLALIITSEHVRFICGYKKAVDRIDEFVSTRHATIKLSIGSLGEHLIPAERSDPPEEDVDKEEKYFIGLSM
jgi:hypothetical protein